LEYQKSTSSYTTQLPWIYKMKDQRIVGVNSS